MRKKTNLTVFLSAIASLSIAQETKPLEINGYADVYYKYDFANRENINTYFGNDHNSISIGMIGLGLKKTTGRASFVGELSFGPRGQYLTIPTGDYNDNSNTFHIQNLYIGYDFTKKFNMTAGYMGTFIGYEVIAPSLNFHYSTSYLFGAGPFQNAGIKGTYNFTEKISLMLGLFNDWNTYQDINGVSHFGGQLAVQPIEGLSAYFNFLSGTSAGGRDEYTSGTIYDLVASYEITDKFSLGLNAADYTFKSDMGGGYSGVALYPQYSISETVALGLRGEYFNVKKTDIIPSESTSSFTLSANIKHEGLTLIPEIRLDNNQNPIFLTKNSDPSKKASQFSLSLVYSF